MQECMWYGERHRWITEFTSKVQMCRCGVRREMVIDCSEQDSSWFYA